MMQKLTIIVQQQASICAPTIDHTFTSNFDTQILALSVLRFLNYLQQSLPQLQVSVCAASSSLASVDRRLFQPHQTRENILEQLSLSAASHIVSTIDNFLHYETVRKLVKQAHAEMRSLEDIGRHKDRHGCVIYVGDIHLEQSSSFDDWNNFIWVQTMDYLDTHSCPCVSIDAVIRRPDLLLKKLMSGTDSKKILSWRIELVGDAVRGLMLTVNAVTLESLKNLPAKLAFTGLYKAGQSTLRALEKCTNCIIGGENVSQKVHICSLLLNEEILLFKDELCESLYALFRADSDDFQLVRVYRDDNDSPTARELLVRNDEILWNAARKALANSAVEAPCLKQDAAIERFMSQLDEAVSGVVEVPPDTTTFEAVDHESSLEFSSFAAPTLLISEYDIINKFVELLYSQVSFI